ncbi:MAG: phage terminase large subunit [Azospirillum sp.]|nr:phage terminase large subunit [Azospirillum sp.]
MTAIRFPEFVWLWDRQQGQSMPRLHDRIAGWLEDRWQGGDRQLLLMAFRGSGKSSLVGLFSAWLLRTDPNLRILVVAADLPLARKMVRTVKRLIERHPATRGLKPKRADQWAADQFTINRTLELRDPSMLARGIEANLTGSRADVVICDDVEVPNTCGSVPKRADLRERLGEIDYVVVPGGLQLYVGTPHSFFSIYAEKPRREIGETAPFLAGFSRLVLPALDSENRSLWPERFSVDRLERQRRHTGAAKFESQMMLNPVNIIAGRLDPDRLRLYDAELNYREALGRAALSLDGRTLVSASCWWDPAYGASAGGGDASVIAVVFADGDGCRYLHRIRYLTAEAGRPDDDEASQQCRQVAAFVQELYLPAVSLEINGLGRFLPGLLRKELARAGIGCAVVEMTSRQSKHQRIVEAFDAVLAAGALWAHRGVWDTPFVQEMRDWRPDGRFKGRDDGLDAVSGCLNAEPVRVGALARPARRADWRSGLGTFGDPGGWDL